MKRFKHLSNRSAREAAFQDMKKSRVNYHIFSFENKILNMNIEVVPLNV